MEFCQSEKVGTLHLFICNEIQHVTDILTDIILYKSHTLNFCPFISLNW